MALAGRSLVGGAGQGLDRRESCWSERGKKFSLWWKRYSALLFRDVRHKHLLSGT
jgi:hypothetical protein